MACWGASDPNLALSTKLLHVDEVEQVFVLEGVDGAQGLLALGQRSEVIVWSLAPVMKIVSLDRAFESFGAQMLIGALADIKQTLIEGLCARQSQTMMRKTD